MIPCFEGLLPLQHNRTVLELLFELANWHALAKLRMHTDVTIDIFESATDHMYAAMRSFSTTTCAAYETLESDAEMASRIRRARVKNPDAPVDVRRKKKEFTVCDTFKYHHAQHLPRDIRRVGPSDGYSTQTVGTSKPLPRKCADCLGRASCNINT